MLNEHFTYGFVVCHAKCFVDTRGVYLEPAANVVRA